MASDRPIRLSALDSLARREHSRFELKQKLIAKGFALEEIESLLDQLVKENLLNDQRFAECYVRMRANRGFGPLHIKQELQERRVDDELAAMAIEALAETWLANAQSVRTKKFGSEIPEVFLERAKQMKYLQYKGFPLHIIKLAMQI